MLLFFFLLGMSAAIIIDMTTHGPPDALCCPTIHTVKRFAVETGRLVAANPKIPDEEGLWIVGPLWEWNGTVYNDGKRVVPPDSKIYTIQWLKNGTLLIKADCNSKGGSYSIKGDNLSVTITHSTLAACPEGSLEGRFVHDLTGGAARLVTHPDTLSLDLNYDAWTMTFSRKKEP
jgi:heat shock protein HslJ